jgi:hypothetical protein
MEITTIKGIFNRKNKIFLNGVEYIFPFKSTGITSLIPYCGTRA